MNTQQVDNYLQLMLESLPFFSRLGTCLGIRLADYAAQMCGCRSTRQMDDSKIEDINETFSQLLNTLQSQINECIHYLDEEHIYKKDIDALDLDSLERLLEDTLFEMTIYNCRSIFREMMFD